MAGYSKRIVEGAFFVTISSIIIAILGYLLRLVLARNLSVEEYGLVYAIISLVTIFSIFVGFTVPPVSLVKYISEFKTKGETEKIKKLIRIIYTFHFVSAFLIGSIFIIFSKTISKGYLGSEKYFILIILYSIFFIIVPLFSLLKDIFRGFQKINYYTWANISQPFFLLIFTLLFVSLDYGISSVFIAYILSAFSSLIIFYFIFIKKVFNLKNLFTLNFDKSLIKNISGFAFPLFLVALFDIVYGRLDSILLSKLASLKDVGLYNAAYPTVSSIWGIVSSVVVFLIPIISEISAKEEYNKIRLTVNTLYKYALVLVLPIMTFIFLFSESVLNILFGNEYIAAATALKILSLGIIMQVLIRINNAVFIGNANTKIMVKFLMVGSILNIFLNLLLIPIMGLNGAAIAMVSSFFVMLSISMVFLKKQFKLKWDILIYIKIILLNILVYFLILFLKSYINNPILLLILIVIVGLTYMLSILYLNIIKIDEIKRYIPFFKNKR
ncbi:flippase [Candidatus Woesearchaeota archaeon]|nr:flippase [Candidatus Woesearchaeota archaeon]